jgi:hypothetical protein
MGQKRLQKYRTLEMLDYALAYTRSTSLPVRQCDDANWELTLSGQPFDDQAYENADAVKTFVNSCLNDVSEMSMIHKTVATPTQEHIQVAGAATGECSGETPRTAMETPSPTRRELCSRFQKALLESTPSSNHAARLYETDATKVMNALSSSIAESERENKSDHDDNDQIQEQRVFDRC